MYISTRWLLKFEDGLALFFDKSELEKAELQYVPSQEGDREDDI